MTIGESKMKNYQESSKRVEVSVDESVRIIRELVKMTYLQ